MAENKKSFVLYADLIHTVKKLSDDKAGVLLKTILEYVNDLNPTVDDILVDLVFEPIKHQLKRDLVRYETFKQKQSENGKLGGRPKKEENPKNPSLSEEFPETQKSLNVNVNVNDTVNDNVNEKKKSVFTPPAVSEVTAYFILNGFSETSAIKAFNYYDSANWKDATGKQVKNWKQKMQGVWFKDDNKIPGTVKSKPVY